VIRAGQAALLCLVGILAFVIPWQFRNQVAYHRFTISEVGESTFQNWYVAQTLASAEGLTRDQASAIIAESGNPMKFSLDVVRRYPGVFVKEQTRGILRTLLGAEYGTWQAIFTRVVPTTTGLLSVLLGQGNGAGLLASVKAQANNPWFWAGIYALMYDIVLAVCLLVGIWRVFRIYQHEMVARLAILAVAALLYLVLIPGVAGESRFRVPADPLLALAAGWVFLPSGISHRDRRER
jgi:hypothetical protein